MRDSLDDLWNAHDACCDTLAGYGVGCLEDFERATRGVLELLLEFERRGRSIEYLLEKAAIAEERGMSCRVLPDPEVVIRGTHPGHPARASDVALGLLRRAEAGEVEMVVLKERVEPSPHEIAFPECDCPEAPCHHNIDFLLKRF